MAVATAAAPDRADPAAVGLRGILARGSALNGAALVLQRGLGFLTNVLIARVGGSQLYGAYALGVSTAGTASNYFGLAIGSTASRFVGASPRGSEAYRRVLRILLAIALLGALAAAVSLTLLARPIAVFVLRNPDLAPLVSVTGLAAAALILQEAATGTLSGLFEFRVLLILPLVTGALTLAGIAIAAPFGASVLLMAYAGAILAGLVLVTVWTRRRLWPREVAPAPGAPPTVRAVLGFALTEVGSGLGVSIATWWVVALVAASDPTLHNAGIFGVAHQLRGLAILLPSFVLPLVIPLLARYEEHRAQVLQLTVFFSTSAFALGACAVLLATPLVPLVYGPAFGGAVVPITVVVAAGAFFAAFSPFLRRLMTVDIRAVAFAYTAQALTLVATATLLVPRLGTTGGGLAWVFGELALVGVVFATLARHGVAVGPTVRLTVPPLVGFAIVAGLATAAEALASVWPLLAGGFVLLALVALLARTANREGLVTRADVARFLSQIRPRPPGS